MRKQIQTAELRIMMQKMLPVKTGEIEKRNLSRLFFLTGGRDEKMHRKRAKNEKYVKISCISGEQNAIL